MPTTLRNFAATLAAVGLLSFGSMTMGQQDAEQPPSDPSSIENVEQAADDAENNAASDAERNSEVSQDDTADASQGSDGNNENSSNDNDNNSNNDSENASADRSDSGENGDDRNADNDRDEERNREERNREERDREERNREERDREERDREERDREERDREERDREERDREAQDEKRDRQENVDADEQLSPPEVPDQARDRDTNAREDVNADWRMIDRDGMTWFYSPSGQWHIRQGSTSNWQAYHDGMHYDDLNGSRNMYGDRSVVRNEGRMMTDGPQRYSTAYRGEEAKHSGNGEQQAQHVRYDRCGRAYICVNGRAVYVDANEASQDVQQTDAQQPTMADEQYQDVPPPPARDDRDRRGEEQGNIPAPPAPPRGA